MKQIPIIQCSYQLNLSALNISARLPLSFRHTLGSQLADISFQFFKGVITTNMTRDIKTKLNKLEELKTKLFVFSMTLRTLKDLKLISYKKHAELSLKISDINRQLSGWTKWARQNC